MRLLVGFDALRERRFRLLFASRTVSVVGGTMADVALAFAVLDIGRPRDLGFVILAREIPIVVLLLAGGVWSDRLPRHLVLVSTDGVRGVAQAVTAALLVTGSASVLSVALLQTLYGSAAAFARPAYQGLVPQVVKSDDLQQANALVGLSNSTVSIAGPAIGAAIVATSQPGWALAADALTFAVSAVLLIRIDLPRTLRATGRSILADFRDGWNEFVSRSWLVAIIIAFGLFQLTYFPALLVLGPYVAKHDLGGAGAWGTILSLEAAGALAGGFLALRVRFSRPLIATMLLVLPAGIVLVLLGLSAPLWLIAGTAFVSGALFALDGAVWFSTLQEKIPEHAISRVSSFDWFGSVALNPIGYALIGPLSEAIGVGNALVLAGALNLATSLLPLLAPAVRNLRAGPEPAPEGSVTPLLRGGE